METRVFSCGEEGAIFAQALPGAAFARSQRL